jgi:hypothetical protein
MIITDTGKYVTTSGKVVIVETTDGYRRAYGKDSNGVDISWYTEDGHVRSGRCNGNDILLKLGD